MLAYLLTRRDYQVTTNTRPIEALKWMRRTGMLAVKSAFDALRVFDRLDFNPDRALPVLNAIFPRDGLTGQTVE